MTRHCSRGMTGVWRLRSSYSLSRKLYCSAVTYPVCSSPTVWGWAASLAERERSERALYRGTTCSGIHLWSQHARQSERDRDSMTSEGHRFSVQHLNFNCGLHSFVRKVLARHKGGDTPKSQETGHSAEL